MNLLKPACVAIALAAVLNTAEASVISTLTYNGHTYNLLDSKNRSASQAEALGLGGYLVTINDAAENQFILDNFANVAGRVWLGLNDVASEGVFEWINGDAVGYTNWEPGEPNNFNDEDYVAMYSGNGRWVDVQDLANPPGIGNVYGVVEINAVPVPAAVWLFGSGVLGLIGVARKKRRV
jgi:hypothetical protein